MPKQIDNSSSAGTQPIRRGDFRLFLGSHVLNETGAAATHVVLPLVAVLSLHASPSQAALIASFSYAAYLVLGLPAGAWVERMRPRRAMMGTDLVRFAALGVVPVAWAAGVLTLPLIYMVALLFGCAQLFGDIADQTYLPHLIGESKLTRGNSILQMIRSGSELGGPGIGGLCVQWLGAFLAVATNALASLVSALLLSRITMPDSRPQPSRGGLGSQIAQGTQFLMRHPQLRMLALTASLNNLVFSGIFALDVVFLNVVLGLGSGMVGMLVATAALGALLGGWCAPRLERHVGGARTAVLAVPATAPFILLLPLAANGWRVLLFACGQIAISIGVTVFNVMQVSYRQRVCPPAMLSRITAIFRFLVWGAAPIGASVGAGLSAQLGVRGTLWVLGGVLIGVSPLLVFTPLRTMRDFEY